MTLRVNVEIVPFGREDEKRTIEVLNISNLGYNDGPDGYSYGVELNKYKTEKYDAYVNHNRSDGAMVLIEKAIGALKLK